jgi:aminoglycoside 2''-phosphotransferase
MGALNLHRIEAELRVEFPSLIASSPLSLIGSGFNSIVVEADGSIIFRIGKNSIAQEGYEKEIRCLSIIAPSIPFLIPLPKYYLKSSTYFPFGVIGYVKIPGSPLHPSVSTDGNSGSVARDMARFLFALHHLPPEELPLKERIDQASKWETQFREVLPFLKAELGPAEFRLVKQWCDRFLADTKMQTYSHVIQHGDLWYENILVDTSMDKLIGIIDWEQLSIGDPSQDFATLFHLGEKFVRLVIQAYQSLGGKLDENFEYRMERLWEAREFEGLHYAIRFDDPIELHDALQKLRQGPILQKLS